MKNNIHLGSHLAEFFLEWKMFQTNFVAKVKKHILCSIAFFFSKSCRLKDKVGKCCRAGHVTDDNMAHAHCVLDTQGYKYTFRMYNTYCSSTARTICTSAPQCYVVPTLPVVYLVKIISSGKINTTYRRHRALLCPTEGLLQRTARVLILNKSSSCWISNTSIDILVHKEPCRTWNELVYRQAYLAILFLTEKVRYHTIGAHFRTKTNKQIASWAKTSTYLTTKPKLTLRRDYFTRD
jgi:hypothetical protein